MKKADYTRHSRFLSFVLRHKPEALSLQLDDHGWVEIPDLLSATRGTEYPMSESLLRQIVEEDAKNRYEIQGTKIRARQGHSRPVDLELKPALPPEVLYHGTARRNLSSIQRHGLQKQKRQYVHLCDDPA